MFKFSVFIDIQELLLWICFVVFFFWTLKIHLGGGPRWYYTEDLTAACKDHWYSYLIYLENFIENANTKYCKSTFWYLSVDFQFFLIPPFIIYCYLKINKWIGWLLIGILCCIGIITSWIIADYYSLDILSQQNEDEYFNYYYHKPYTRIPPYAIGLLCGFILFNHKKYKETALFMIKSL